MFSIKEKQLIAKTIEELLLSLHHPEMPDEKPVFKLHVNGKAGWSWADIEPNWSCDGKDVNLFNEIARDIMEEK